MKITQIRNATIIVELQQHVILVDPMLAKKGGVPSLKYATTRRRRNPLINLPKGTSQLLQKVTHCLITHCQKGHFDHLDKAAIKWLIDNNIPVFCSDKDAAFLQKKGLSVHSLDTHKEQSFLEGKISLIPCLHGQGLVGKFMSHGYGYVITQADEPKLYITGDTILTSAVKDCITQHKPEIIVLPAGGAIFDIGSEVIMGLDDAIQVAELTDARIIANHIESLDHCPVTREQLRTAVNNKGWKSRFHVPADGEEINIQIS